MAKAENTGGAITNSDVPTTDIFILLDSRVSKYKDTDCAGRLQGMTGLQPNTVYTTEEEVDTTNLMNSEPIVTNKIIKSAVIIAKIPKEIKASFKTKFIPPGTMFDCTFLNGDLSKIKITGIHPDPDGDVNLGGKINERTT